MNALERRLCRIHMAGVLTPRISAHPRTKTPTSDDRFVRDGVRPRALSEPRKLVSVDHIFPVVVSSVCTAEGVNTTSDV